MCEVIPFPKTRVRAQDNETPRHGDAIALVIPFAGLNAGARGYVIGPSDDPFDFGSVAFSPIVFLSLASIAKDELTRVSVNRWLWCPKFTG